MTTNTGTTTYHLPPNITFHHHRDAGERVENWLILGTGPTSKDDWNQVCHFPLDFLGHSELVLLNRAELPVGTTYAAHHVTYHSEVFHVAPTVTVREKCARRHSNVAMPWTTDCWLIPDQYHVGGSAFLAAYIAGQLGIKRAVLIGCPMTGGPEHEDLLQQLLDAPTDVWKYYRRLVSSMSGMTRELFGAPSTI